MPTAKGSRKRQAQGDGPVLKARCDGLDDSWLRDLLRKRSCNASVVLIAETDDPIRVDQVLHFFVAHGQQERAGVFCLDPWLGLRRHDAERKAFVPANPDGSRRSAAATGSSEASPLDTADVLREMDAVLKRDRSVLILRDLESPLDGHRDAHISYAIRSWRLDPELLANGSTVVLITSNAVRVVDPATSDSLAWSRAPLATREERTHLVRFQAECLGLDLDEHMTSLVTITSGLSLHQLESTLLESWHRESRFDPGTVKKQKAEIIKRSGIVEVQEPDPRGFGAIGGYDAVKQYIRDWVTRPLAVQKRAGEWGTELPKGILLFGPPGTGKTIFAKALAHEVNLPFIRLRVEELYSKYLGESGRLIASAIQIVEQMSPAIVFVDEIDRFGRRAGEDSDGASQETRRVFAQILEWLGNEGRKSIVVGTTNVPEHLDEAFTRPGRLERSIPLLYPNAEARREILRIHLGLTGAKPEVPWVLTPEERDKVIGRLAAETAGFTGAELEDLCRRARGNGFLSGERGMTAAHLQSAFDSIGFDTASREKRYQHYFAMAKRFTNDKAFLTALGADR